MALTLTTHVLDTTHGRPAAAVEIVLRDGSFRELGATATNEDGRAGPFDLAGPGRYTLAVAVGRYFAQLGIALADPPFLDEVVIAFGAAGEGHYHVPLLVSPHGYTTYRGS